MPVTKTAKRALRSSAKKAQANFLRIKDLQTSLRLAKKSKKENDVKKVLSLVDRAVKKNLLHKNKASRMKSRLVNLTLKAKTPKSK